jgi:hypothetical protein
VKVEGVGLGAKVALGDRRSVGAMHDADDFVPVTGAGWNI